MQKIDENLLDAMLGDQVPDATLNELQSPKEDVKEEAVIETPKSEAAQYLGQKLTHNIGNYQNTAANKEEGEKLVSNKKLTKIGENIKTSADIRDGWMEVDKRLLGNRAQFYPADWQFRIRPATVEAIRNWSTIDDENPYSIDTVLNEILKSCIMIVTPQGPLPWGNIRSWDRFFFILLIREYTFIKGEKAIEIEEDCVNCENPVKFALTSLSLDFDLPDPEVMPYFNNETQTWLIDPSDFDIEGEEPLTLYLPTLDKDEAVRTWMVQRYQDKKKVDNVFLRFIPWLAQKISKDEKVASRQIRDLEVKYKGWDTEMFSFMDSVIKNITVTPSPNLITTCPVCGEEVTTQIRFPNGVSDLFAVSNRHKKFGKK